MVLGLGLEQDTKGVTGQPGDTCVEKRATIHVPCKKTKYFNILTIEKAACSYQFCGSLQNTENIEILFNTETEEVLGENDLVTGVRVKNNKTGESKEIPCTGFFVAIGHDPNTKIFKDYINLDDAGYIEYAEPGTAKTNVAGVNTYIIRSALEYEEQQDVPPYALLKAYQVDYWILVCKTIFQLTNKSQVSNVSDVLFLSIEKLSLQWVNFL